MFIVRERHLEALARARSDDFVRRAARDLRKRHARLDGVPEQGLQGWIAQSMQDAERYHLRTEAEVVTFLEYRLLYGHDFPEGEDHTWALAILTDEAIDVPERLVRLDEMHARFCLMSPEQEAP
ncbi:MAG: hypothetical protein JNK72_15500 [Myxococcales bacterium]|nr:hypothetical protein [Myxococcales bacterium]